MQKLLRFPKLFTHFFSTELSHNLYEDINTMCFDIAMEVYNIVYEPRLKQFYCYCIVCIKSEHYRHACMHKAVVAYSYRKDN